MMRIQGKWFYLAAAAFVVLAVLFYGSGLSGFARDTEEEAVYKYYTSIPIEKGDTLWSIAAEYMSEEYDGIEEYIREIRRLNHLCGDRICAGEYLAIPRYGADP